MARDRRLVLPLAVLAVLALVVLDIASRSFELVFLVPSAGSRTEHLRNTHFTSAPARAPAALQQQPAAKAPLAGQSGFGLEQGRASVPSIAAATILAAAAASADSSSKKSPTGSVWDSIKLPVFVGLWYFFNVQYNIENKLLLSTFDATWAVSWLQLAAGIPIAGLMWLSGLLKVPKVTTQELVQLAPVGLAFAAGQVATVASLGSVAVSFTHVVKALEPAVNAMGSALILGQVFHPMVYLSLMPIFIGVALASSAELSFTPFGFATAMASNFCFVARNVLATKFGSVGDMGEDKTTRKTNQLAVLTFVATLVLLPVALVLPGGLLSIPGAWERALANGVKPDALLLRLALTGFHFFMYQMSSFWVLSCVQPITHSVLNTLKRVVIIIVSILVFQNPVTTQSAIGTGTAIGGVLLYSLVKAHYSKKTKAEKAAAAAAAAAAA